MLVSLGLITQCDKYGEPGGGMGGPTGDSDSPPWAGGNTGDNPHIRGNDDSGTTRGGDYGDLYVLLRDLDGVPVMRELPELDEEGNPTGETFWVVQPVDVDGNLLELDAEGELVNPELAQEVDFGRLNIVRSPQGVLDQAFEEALKVLAEDDAVITLDFCGRLTSTYTDNATGEVIVKTIDSPRENMAIYQYIMKFMFEDIEGEPNTNRLQFLRDEYGLDPLIIAAACFAAGSDKTGFVDIDEAVYVSGFVDGTGLNPIENEHEYDFNNDNKWYFNYGDPYDCDCEEYQFRYKRSDAFADRYIQFLVWGTTYYPEDENGVSESPYIYSVLDVMEGGIPSLGGSKFTYMWQNEFEYRVKGFAMAIDDAVQVLEYVHGNTNIKFLPGYDGPTGPVE